MSSFDWLAVGVAARVTKDSGELKANQIVYVAELSKGKIACFVVTTRDGDDYQFIPTQRLEPVES